MTNQRIGSDFTMTMMFKAEKSIIIFFLNLFRRKKLPCNAKNTIRQKEYTKQGVHSKRTNRFYFEDKHAGENIG